MEFALRGYTQGLAENRVWTDIEVSPPDDLDDPKWADPKLSRPLLDGEWEPRLRVSNLIGEALKWRSRDEPFGRCGEKQFKYTISGTFIEQFEIEAFLAIFKLYRLKYRLHYQLTYSKWKTLGQI